MMFDQLAADIRGLVDDGAPPISLAELEIVALDGTPSRPRRRWPVLAAAAVAVALIVATIILVRTASDDGGTVLTPAGPAPSQPPSAPSVPASFPLGAPLVEGPDASSTILTSWGEFHLGYVFVYGDGRVIWYSDIGAYVDPDMEVTGAQRVARSNGVPSPYGDFRYVNIERHLSPLGLELLLAGQLDMKGLLVGPYPGSRRELWVEPTATLWEPTAYALCPSRPIGGGGISVNATDVVDELPEPVRAVLDGKQRSYDPSMGTADWEFPGTASGLGMTDCFELTAAETSNLYQIIEANGFIGQDPIQGAENWVRVFAYGNLSFAPEPIFPHGQHVIWGG
jgi:hypothetical protein